MSRMTWLALVLLGAQSLARAAAPYPPESIYQLPLALTDQGGVAQRLDLHRGHPVLITMFYGSCPAACPLLIDTLRAVERAAPATRQAQLRVLMVSIDPACDTPQSLQALARTRRIDTARWTLAAADEQAVRKLAAVLGIQYRRLPDGGFNHSSIITLLNGDGEIAAQSAVLGKADARLLDALARLPR